MVVSQFRFFYNYSFFHIKRSKLYFLNQLLASQQKITFPVWPNKGLINKVRLIPESILPEIDILRNSNIVFGFV